VAAEGLYARTVDGWAGLPAGLRRLHEPGRAAGTFEVSWGDGFWARTMAHVMRLPPPNPATAVELSLTLEDGVDVWARSFGGVRLVSRQVPAGPGILRETLDVVECEIAVGATDGTLVFRTLGARLALGPLRLPIPRFFAPQVSARAACAPGDPQAISVEVTIGAPWTGRILRYAGTVRPAA
jgi:hypothetical protein